MLLRFLHRSGQYPANELQQLVEKEKSRDFTDADLKEQLACEACLPDAANKEKMWVRMINQDNLNTVELDYLASSFYNSDDQEMCEKYADMFLEAIFDLKIKFHRDYFDEFFTNLLPASLGRQQDLDKLKAIQKRVISERPDDSHFLKLLSEAIQKLEMVISIRVKW